MYDAGVARFLGDTPPVANEPVAEAPVTFRLRAAYPNPFNPQTVIPSEMGEAGHVRLSVHDVLGREVLRLLNEQRTAGAHEVVLNGRGLPFGTYLVRMSANTGFTQTRRVTLLQ